MQRTIAPAASVRNTNTTFGHAFASTIAIARQLWRHHRYRADLHAMLHLGPHLFADIGMTKEYAEEEANAPFWQSPHVPPLRHF